MKNFLLLIVLLGVAFYVYNRGNFNFKGFSLGSTAPVVETSPGSSSHDFNAVSVMLQQDMDSIPNSLDGDGVRPVHAIDVKRRLRPHLNLHQEYQVLTRVCDLILQADAERTSRLQSVRAEQTRTTFHSSLEVADPRKPKAQDTSGQQAAIRQRVESGWSSYRAQIAGEVEKQLGTLKGKTI